MSRYKTIRPFLAFSRMSIGDFLLYGLRALAGMDGNVLFPNPPVSMADFRAALDSLAHLMAATLNRGTRTTIARDDQRNVVTRMLRLLSFYAADVCKYDHAGYATSGLDEVHNKVAPVRPLDPCRILAVKQGRVSGEVLVQFNPVGARKYQVRYGLTGVDPETYTVLDFPRAKPGSYIGGLTPGTIYAFQVRAYGKAGFTDWSSIVTKMSI